MRFLGWSIFKDLLGRESFLGLVVLGLTGRRITAEESALVDEMAATNAAADPRIWAFKAARLIAAHGDPLAGAVCGQLCVLDAKIGPSVATKAAEMLKDVRAAVGQEEDDSVIQDRILAYLDSHDRLYGFGVPYRERDERFFAMMERIHARGFAKRPHCRLIDPLVKAVVGKKTSLAPNSALTCAAVCLDLGFEPRQVGPFIMVMFLLPTIANTFEESELRSPALRELPVDSIDYVGQAPRRSPRAGISPSPGDGE
jgi:hypothetical protein